MAFPAVSVVPPVLSNWTAYFQGITFGVNNGAYAFYPIDGLFGNAPIRSADTARPRDQGEFVGLDLYGGTTEYPFYIQLPNLPLLVTMARCRKFSYPINLNYGAGLADPVNMMFHSTDPRLYTAPTNSTSCGLPSPTGGFGFNVSFNLSFGGSSSPNSVSVANTGNFEMRPLVSIAGPCVTPSIANGSITGNPTLQFGVTLNAGDTLVVDLDAHTATLNGTASRLNTLQPGFTWWNLPANTTSVITFNSQDTSQASGTMAVQAPAGSWVF